MTDGARKGNLDALSAVGAIRLGTHRELDNIDGQLDARKEAIEARRRAEASDDQEEA